MKTEESIKACTFKPQIIKKKSNKQEEKTDGFERLYSMAQKKRERNNKNTDDYIYEKNPEEFTFKPTINKTKRRESPNARKNL